MEFLKQRLKEKSTWVAIFATIGSVTGYVIAPEYADAITALAVGILSGTAFFTKSK